VLQAARLGDTGFGDTELFDGAIEGRPCKALGKRGQAQLNSQRKGVGVSEKGSVPFFTSDDDVAERHDRV
jgi:hypothetical protein